MTSFVLIHGAFRGGWSWRWVREELEAAGHDVWTPSLAGMGDRTHLRPSPLGLSVWIDDVVSLVELNGLSDIVLAGHSQGGLVITAAAARLSGRISSLAFLDAPMPRDGERGVDLTPVPEGIEAPPLPPSDTWIPARPLDASAGLDPERLAWVNERVCPTPLRPSLDPVVVAASVADIAARHVYFSGTPEGYPADTTRRRLEAAGVPFDRIDAPHDAPLSHPRETAAWLAS